MQEHRHPHPHRDPRQPRDGSRAGTNPPVFAWKPDPSGPYTLTVAADETLARPVIALTGLADPLHLPERALAPGQYWWRWSAGGRSSQVFAFEVSDTAAVVEVPPAGEWLRRLPTGHPRIYLRPEELPALRASRDGERAERWRHLREVAERLLAEPHELAEPDWLPDRRLDYQAFFVPWSRILWESRRFMVGAQTLALAWLAGGDVRYARAACRRMASVSRWDPDGPSSITHNDEAHMSVIWHGANVCDWVWEQFTEDERELVIDQFRRRGRITYEHMHGHGSYGVSRFDSHAGREIVFLGLIGLVFHDRVPEAVEWLEWLRPVLCGIWPIWAGDDGAWAEGPSYGLAYITIMTMFATALKRGAGVDLYQRPFWRNHARWRSVIQPPYAEWIGFGDHTERWRGSWRSTADLVEIIARETGSGEFGDYVAAVREAAEQLTDAAEREAPMVSAQGYLGQMVTNGAGHGGRLGHVFADAGWAGIRTAPDQPQRDLAFLFRSSPYGAVSHSHANQNDFILHVAGKVMAMPSGYYDGYGSNHHAHWVWHTRSHNCLTLSEAGQIQRSHESAGAVEQPFEDERLVYFRGTANDAYREAERCRRHVTYLKRSGAFVLIDEFVAAAGASVAVQWNLHSWAPFAVDEARRAFRLEREDSVLSGWVLHHANGYFTLTSGWDPPPTAGPNRSSDQWLDQHHLRYTCAGFPTRLNLGVVLCPAAARIAAAEVTTGLDGLTELATIGDDQVRVGSGGRVSWNGVEHDAVALLATGGAVYAVRDDGLEESGDG